MRPHLGNSEGVRAEDNRQDRSHLNKWAVIGGKLWRKKEVSLSRLWNTRLFLQTMRAHIRGPRQRM